MRKITEDCENPLDNILIHISDISCEYAHNIGLTPNMLTTISIIFCGITVILLLKSYFYIAAITFLISYYFDCMDGHFARKYNMVTVFGDYYDHIADFGKLIAVLYTLYILDSRKFFIILPFLIILFILSGVHLGCQELYYDTNESATLAMTKYLCIANDKKDKTSIINALHITRYFGCGTFNIGIILAIIYYGV